MLETVYITSLLWSPMDHKSVAVVAVVAVVERGLVPLDSSGWLRVLA